MHTHAQACAYTQAEKEEELARKGRETETETGVQGCSERWANVPNAPLKQFGEVK